MLLQGFAFTFDMAYFFVYSNVLKSSLSVSC